MFPKYKKKKDITVQEIQAYVKKRHSASKKHRQKYFLKLIEEVGELSEMIKSDRRLEVDNGKAKAIKNTIEEEMADVLYYLLALANTYNVDLLETFIHKQRYNKKFK